MDAFSAVVTTGIYCRPGCGGRPHARNVRSYASAAAAEAAGFRACLQCRPYRWPQTLAWEDPELVCRAVRLVLAGALDRSTEDGLGARLGVSARHLRRLFAAHVGVTPGGLARSARTHLARRLLDDTDLTVAEIAFAAGFGCVRQLNRACHDVFSAPPGALRARRRKADRLAADGGLPLRLAYRGPLDWDGLVADLGEQAIPGVEVVTDGVYRRTIVVEGDPGVLELRRGGGDDLVAVAHLPHWEPLAHLVARARRIASLDLDPAEPAARLAADPLLGPLLRARPGLRPPGAWDGLEAGVLALLGRGRSPSAARTLAGRLAARAGVPVPGLEELGLRHAFPAPARLAAADLSGLGIAPRAARAVRGLARAVAEDAVRLDGSTSLDALVGSLAALDGVDARTAHEVALRLGEPDAFPAEGPAGDPRGERWRPWRALAATHLRAAGRAEPARLAA